MLYTDTVHYTIRYSAPLSMVEIIWHDSINSEQLQTGLIDALKVIRLHQAKFFLIDARKVNSLKSNDQAWIKNFLLLELQKACVCKFARITDPSALTLAIISNVLEYVQRESLFDFKMQSFFDRDKALDWLFEPVTV